MASDEDLSKGNSTAARGLVLRHSSCAPLWERACVGERVSRGSGISDLRSETIAVFDQFYN